MIGKLAALGIGSFATCAAATLAFPQTVAGLVGLGVGLAQQGWNLIAQNALVVGATASLTGAGILAGARAAYNRFANRLKQGASEAVSNAESRAIEFNQTTAAKLAEANNTIGALKEQNESLQTQLNQTANIRTELETLKKENQRIMDEYNALMRIQAIKENLPETRPTVG
jgi:hypothetical protein